MNMSSIDEYDDDENFFDGDTLPFEEEDSDKHGFCETCDQDYDGSCPESSPDCPINFKGEEEEEEDFDEEDDSDFDDIDDIDEIVGYDEEAEKLIEEEEEIPPEDLVDEEEVEEVEEENDEEEVESVDEEEDDDYLYK